MKPEIHHIVLQTRLYHPEFNYSPEEKHLQNADPGLPVTE